MAYKLVAAAVCCLALAAAVTWQRLYYTDLSAVENLYTILAYLMARPQYLLHLHNIAQFRESSDAAMGDFMMRESQSVAFRLSLTLEASYKSHADEDGLEDWAVAPKNPPDILTYDEVYVKRKLEPPTDPESVIIDRPHSFPPEIPAQLLPPHPMHPHSSSSEQVATQEHAQQLNTISIRLYTPATCSEATGLSSSSCKSVHQQLFRTTRKAVSIDGIYFFDIQTEAMSLEGLDDPSQQKKEQEHRRPVLFFLHGGGLVGLSTASYDKLIRRMTNLLGAADGIVISIDYRLSPEHKFPVPMEDCLYAISFLVKHAQAFGIDSSKIALIGDSAGGALVVSVLGEALRLPQRYPWVSNVRHASLVYPSLCRGCPTRSHLLYGNKHTLKSDIWFAFAHTSTIGPVWDWRQMPFAIPSNILSQFPPTSLVLFTHDIQYETGVLFHERLRRAGVSTSLFIAPGMHAFFGSDCWSTFGVQTVEWAIQRIINSLNADRVEQDAQ